MFVIKITLTGRFDKMFIETIHPIKSAVAELSGVCAKNYHFVTLVVS